MSPLLHSEDANHLRLYMEIIEERIEQIEKIIFKSSEDLDSQDDYLQYNNLSDAEAVISHLQSLIKFGKDHLKIIDQFGRYPHRNIILDRESDYEE